MKKTLLFAAIVAVIVWLGATPTPGQRVKKVQPKTQALRVEITSRGYEPGSIALKRNIPAKIIFRRTVESTCATEVVFADYGINRPLPLNQDVVVTFTPRKTGQFAFTCGMNMHRGKVIVS